MVNRKKTVSALQNELNRFQSRAEIAECGVRYSKRFDCSGSL